jgi:hypothetical protein
MKPENIADFRFLDLLADDKSLITYRPRLNIITGSVTATILLQQIIFLYKRNNYQPFYKFKQSCEHRFYKVGESWCEELGFSKSEFDIALKLIAVKVNSNNRDNPPPAMVYYWITQDRTTFFEVNLEYLNQEVSRIYVNLKSDLGKSKSRHSSKSESGFSKSGFTSLDNTESHLGDEMSLILSEAEKDLKFVQAFNDFCVKDDSKYRSDTTFWILHNAILHEASIGAITDALEICVGKDKTGDVAYFTGILRQKAKNKADGIRPLGKNDYIRVVEYLRRRLEPYAEYITSWEADIKNGCLRYSVASRDDLNAIKDALDLVAVDLQRETGIILSPKHRLDHK